MINLITGNGKNKKKKKMNFKKYFFLFQKSCRKVCIYTRLFGKGTLA
jgi:hypothetical protein